MSLANFISKAGVGALSRIGEAYRRAGSKPQVYVHAPPPRAGGAPEDTTKQVLDKFGLSHVQTNKGYGITTPYDYQAELVSRQGLPTLVERMSRPSDKRYALEANATRHVGTNPPGKFVEVEKMVGDSPVLNFDTMLWERGKGGSEAYQGLFGLTGPMDAYNATMGLSEINRLRRPSNMLSFITRHPEHHNRPLLSADTGLISLREPGMLPMDPETWTKLSPEEKIGWLAMRERFHFDLMPDMGGSSTSARSGKSGLTQMLMHELEQGTTNLDQIVDDTLGAGMWDKSLYAEGGLVR